jgi:hypothetical protein
VLIVLYDVCYACGGEESERESYYGNVIVRTSDEERKQLRDIKSSHGFNVFT